MSAIPARRRRRAVAAVVTGALALAVLPAGVVVGSSRLLNEKGGDSVDDSPTTRIPVTPTALLAVTNSRNEVASLAMIALDPSGRGGSIVSIPVGANAEIPRNGTIHRIADSYATGGLAGLRADVEGLLNVSFNFADDLTGAELAAVIGTIGNRDVNLPAPVLDTAADDTAVQIVPAGQQTISPLQIANSLASSQTGVAESTRLPNVKALWEVIAGAATTTPATAGSSTTVGGSGFTNADEPTDMMGYLEALLKGRVQVWQISATLLTDAARNPANADLYELDGGEVIMVMASVAPSAIALVSNSIAVMIDSPFDDPQLVRQAVLRLAYVGANVVVVRTIDAPPVKETQVFYSDEAIRNDVQGYTTLMGEMRFNTTSDVIEGVNVRIVLGEDFRTFIGSPGGQTISTTTTSTVP